MNEDYGASVTSSEYAIAIDPHDPDSFLAKAHALYCLENYEEALNYFKRYSEMRSNDELGFLHQGTCLINLGRYDEAIACLEEAKDLQPTIRPTWQRSTRNWHSHIARSSCLRLPFISSTRPKTSIVTTSTWK